MSILMHPKIFGDSVSHSHDLIITYQLVTASKLYTLSVVEGEKV